MKGREVTLRRSPLVRLHRGDCLQVMARFRAESYDSIVCDPPYGIKYHDRTGRRPSQTILNDERPFIWWLHEAARVLRAPGALLCFCRWDVQQVFRQAIEVAGLRVRGQLVWDRKRHGIPNRATLLPRHDVMWFATKGRFTFPDRIAPSLIQVPSVRGKARLHPTEKPAALMRQLVKFITPRGGRVLDPCMGSGSTGECVRDGFGFVGVELDGAHFLAAVGRLRKAVADRKARKHVVTEPRRNDRRGQA